LPNVIGQARRADAQIDQTASSASNAPTCSDSSSAGRERHLERGAVYRRARANIVDIVGGGDAMKSLYGAALLPNLNTVCGYRDDLRESLAVGGAEYEEMKARVFASLSNSLLPVLDMLIVATQVLGRDERLHPNQTDPDAYGLLRKYFEDLATKNPDDLL